MIPTFHQLQLIAGRNLRGDAAANARSVIAGLEAVGGMRPHRLAHYLAQLAHESGGFRFDGEVWGPTAAQKRYDTRTDLGNTPERDGDGKKYRGRTAIQITGKANVAAFRDWCRARFKRVPDFVENPDAMNTDPWEGLGPIWYWATRALDRYADRNDAEMVTRRINGGLNGYKDRLHYYTRSALVLLGWQPDDVRGFQKEAGLAADGIPGPRTRAALHDALVALDEGPLATQPPKQPATGFWAALRALFAAIFGGRNA